MAVERSASSPADRADAELTFAVHAARLMADNKCENVLVLDLRGISQVADYFVIATGTSERQLRSVGEELKLLARLEGQAVFRSHGLEGGSAWVIMDCVNIVAHLLTPEQRAYYDLEGLWGDAVKIDWVSRTTPGQFARIATQKAG